MKPSFRRLQEQYGQKHISPAMQSYKNTLQKLVNATGDGNSYRDDERPLNIKMRVGEVYAVRATDDDRYFFTVTIQPNAYSGGFRKVISEYPVYGDPPPGMQTISQEQMFKQFRELNGDGASTNFSAFPFKGHMTSTHQAPGNGLVSDLHKGLLGRDTR